MAQSEANPPSTFHQGALPSKPRIPSGREAWAWLDDFVDRFNGPHENGPIQNPLYCRHAIWRRARKYESEDINSCVEAYARLCPTPELNADQTAVFLAAMRAGFELHLSAPTEAQDRAHWKEQRSKFEAALAAAPEAPVGAARRVEGHLWLRAALQAVRDLPAPWPDWPMELRRNLDQSNRVFTGGSENWTSDNHEDATFGLRTLLKELRDKGWFIETGAD